MAFLQSGVADPAVCLRRKTPVRFFDQGVGQLHGFWYFEAERSFRQAAAIDPDCAMAYWGMAMANTNNAKRAKAFLAEAVNRKSGLAPRETKYLDALDAWHKADANKKKERAEAYIKSLEKLLFDHPEDMEAKAFLGLALWQNRDSVPIASYLAVEALLKDVVDAEPLHPCHHYLIHLWDSEKAERALDSAARCGPAAPAIAHMWHMPGHTYSKLKRYQDAAWQQEASARVDHAHMMRDRVLPDQIHNFAHNNEWLIRNRPKSMKPPACAPLGWPTSTSTSCRRSKRPSRHWSSWRKKPRKKRRRTSRSQSDRRQEARARQAGR
jgi:tetratricopeptide (TPR) repeat protein